MKQVIYRLLVIILLFCVEAKANCNGSLLLFSDSNEVIEDYGNKVRVYLPLRIKVSQSLLNCADSIVIDAVDSYNIKFYGPSLKKNGKLLDNQFRRITLRNGFYWLDLDERETQTWVRLQHYTLFPAGSYYSRIRVSIIADGYIVREQLIDMEYYSEPKISIELDNNSQGKVTGGGGDFQIDLGELTTGRRFDWGIKVLSNSAYDLVVDSEYNGLMHETNFFAVIPYSLTFDNVKMSSYEQIVRNYDFFNGVKNTWFGFSFVLGSVEMMPSGNYQDNISLTIYPY